ncbi:AAA family ATPase [Vitreoscilla massiliensis]|uniref:AAA family ATPase n=1 Tax=Vitreoscilla massiliensis TaxID=1689272 RepID=A0ABY4E3B7_9NEIS|nr:AAA family ATPase [Vitreoscilla massiliensis]UOO90248.1 AAA family ATPase [Vitreoscilla massiliensis]
MKFGFTLRRLSLIGQGKVPAEVTFERGLNVIAGPSDSGKSFIAHCLDYALGGRDTPKDIPQANGYSSVVIDIEANSDRRIYTLERSLHGGNVLCKTNGQPDRVLAAKHQPDKKDTISQFLLDLSGLGMKKVRTNEQGKTRPLSFRDIARLVIIDEETIIQENSPTLSGQYTSKTVEGSVFRLLLTGTDDSSIIAKEDLKIAKGRQTGKVELLDDLLKATRARLTELGESRTLVEERDRLTRIEASIQTALDERNAAQTSVVPLQTKRNTAWTALKAVESKLAVLSELQTRFDLLGQQYKSDLRRLEAIAEAGAWLDQLKEERCPMCGALAEYQHHEHPKANPTPADVSLACKAEATKTMQLFMDLQTTRATNAAKVEQLQVDRDTRRTELDVIASELKDLMEQHVDVASKKVDEFRVHAETCRKMIEYLERIQELEELLENVNKPKKKQKSDMAGAAVSTAQADLFCREVEVLLREWHFPGLDHVSFSESDQDVVISGHARKSHGKGIRAITRAAFNLALLRLCIANERPFPNFILIDSPLLVYEEPDAGDLAFPHDVKKHFWESVKSSFIDAQVIIIENSNQLPDDGTLDGVKVELFTGNEQGRMGFIPT